MHVYMYIYMYIYIWLYMYVYIYMIIYVYVCVHGFVWKSLWFFLAAHPILPLTHILFFPLPSGTQSCSSGRSAASHVWWHQRHENGHVWGPGLPAFFTTCPVERSARLRSRLVPDDFYQLSGLHICILRSRKNETKTSTWINGKLMDIYIYI